MKKITFALSVFLLICLVFVACKKENNTKSPTGNVELFLIDSYETIANTPQIINNTVKTKDAPLIYYSEILSYDSKNHVLKIADKAKERINNLEASISGIAFAVKARNELIYTGYFVSMLSSSSIVWVTISPYQYMPDNELSINLGYPSSVEGESIPDNRNDSRVIDIFRRDNKLIE